jgi:hypothetical protein
MGWDASELDEWVTGLERLEKDLNAGMEDVFQRNEDRYLQMARQVSRQFLLAVPNEDLEPEVWAQRIEDFVDLVFSRQRGNAFEIFYHGRTESDKPGDARREITYDDVLNWVKAGPENGGKDKTILEQERGRQDGRVDEHIAYNVWEAIAQYRLGTAMKDYGPITERLERWVDFGESGNKMLDHLPTILNAWAAALEPVLAEDLDDFLDRAIRRM